MTPVITSEKFNHLHKKEAKMETQTTEFKDYILLVHLPVDYGPDNAKEVRVQWNALLEKWKIDGAYVTSFVYPNDGYLVTGSETPVTNEDVLSNHFKLVSNVILRVANFEAALASAKSCPVLEQGGVIEVREIQPRPNSDEQIANSDLTRHKAIIRNLYEGILNTGKLELLKEIISDDYIGVRGEKGPEGFAETVNSIRSGFPDIEWRVEDLVADGNKVTVRWSWKGTNKGSFRGFAASNNEVVDHAIAIYEFSGDKIIRAWIQSDKLGFLQQIGVIPQDITTPEPQK